MEHLVCARQFIWTISDPSGVVQGRSYPHFIDDETKAGRDCNIFFMVVFSFKKMFFNLKIF